VPIDLSQEWATADPESAQVDAARLSAAFAAAPSVAPSVQSVLVVRNGLLAGEQYYGGTGADTLFDVRSVTKSVASLLVGIAIAQGKLPDTGERLDALVHPPVAQVSAAEAPITVENLLTMTSGFSWDESTAAGYNDWILAANQVDYLLQKPLAAAPGTRFTYNSAAVHLLSVGLTLATGTDTLTYAQDNLFSRLSITQHEWEVDQQGYYNGGSGLALRGRDLAKIGQLVLQGGLSAAGKQVVPKSWIDAMLQTHWTVGGAVGPLQHLQYGYLWWLASSGGHRIAFAWGYRGQYVFLVPDLHLVVVVASRLDDRTVDPDLEADQGMSLIVGRILPAIR
jgi:CubicO group peptidase (beta-lactamase class C family)